MSQENNNNPATLAEADQRAADRREVSWMTFHGALFKSRRKHARRSADKINNYLDWHGHKPLIATLIILVLCFADALFTTILLKNGAVEMNVLMDWLIQKDMHIFTIVKMAVTSIGLFVLIVHFNFRIYRFIQVRYVLYALVPVYVVLILHELNMLSSI